MLHLVWKSNAILSGGTKMYVSWLLSSIRWHPLYWKSESDQVTEWKMWTCSKRKKKSKNFTNCHTWSNAKPHYIRRHLTMTTNAVKKTHYVKNPSQIKPWDKKMLQSKTRCDLSGRYVVHGRADFQMTLTLCRWEWGFVLHVTFLVVDVRRWHKEKRLLLLCVGVSFSTTHLWTASFIEAHSHFPPG